MSETFLADDLDFLGTVLETEPSRMRCKSKRGMKGTNTRRAGLQRTEKKEEHTRD